MGDVPQEQTKYYIIDFKKIYDTIKIITQGQCESLTDKKD